MCIQIINPNIRSKIRKVQYYGEGTPRLCSPMALGGKGKSVPLQALSGPEGSRKIMFPDFMTTAHDGGKVVSLTHRPPLPLENTVRG